MNLEEERTRMHIDVFNGDADGLCALQQWRLSNPADSRLVTGAKRDIHLLAQVKPQVGDTVTVFDISLRVNREDALRIVSAGASLLYFDHHEGAEFPTSPAIKMHLDPSPKVCTSLLVDRELGGAHRPWAIAAAFGDNLDTEARRIAGECGISPVDTEALAELGRLLNYNAYGDVLADLHFHPAALYTALRPYRDPLDAWRDAPQLKTLRTAYAEDWELANKVQPAHKGKSGVAVLLPATSWARRIHGVLANRMADAAPTLATAVLVENEDGTIRVSVRAPKARPSGADRLCRSFETGGGRALAAGISRLPKAEMERFLSQFEQAFSAAAR